MSWNQENVVWQSKDGSWNIGFFSSYSGSSGWNDEDYDPEWDVEYDYDSFFFASVGHPTELAAWQTWKGANPGMSTTVKYSEENAERIAKYDLMARNHLHPEIAQAEAQKERDRLKQEHLKALGERFKTLNNFKNLRVKVSFKTDESIWDRFGGFQSHVGFLKQEGDWLMIDGVKVKNTKTGKLNDRLAKVEIVERDFHGYYRY